MSASFDRSSSWVFYASAGFLFAGVVLRAALVIEDRTVLLECLLLLLVWLALFVGEPWISRRWRLWPALYMVLQTTIVAGLFILPGDDDFFAVLFAALSMQALQRFGLWGAAWLAAFVPLMLFAFLADYQPGQAVALTLAYTAVNVFLGLYALATRRAEQARNHNRALGQELESANAELQEYLERLESLAVARERNRIGRELHDSVTQTIFSMTLASQSAAILLQREPSKVDVQLERLSQLAESALAEMRLLISELKPDVVSEGDLAAAIRADVERRNGDGMDISFVVDQAPLDQAAKPLSPAEQTALVRIAQEAVNNIVKHAGTREAAVRLTLGERPRLEIRDRGAGFDLRQAQDGTGMGLAGMRERAAEIGWALEVESSPGQGTQVVARRAADRKGER